LLWLRAAFVGWIRRQVAQLEKRMDRERQTLAAEIGKRIEAVARKKR
jgi:hypothetical protein